MKAFVINRYKDPLRVADVPEPALGIATCWCR
jgi:hypothetical protein